MIPAGEKEIIAAIDRRLAQLRDLAFRNTIGSPLAGLTLV
jgi:hypothetical protein